MKNQLCLFDVQEKVNKRKVVNVASVPQRSPFRYPGGKTWLIPTVRDWLKQDNKLVDHLFEPFAGGGIVGLTTAFEGLANQVTMVEMDEEIAAVWEVILNGKNRWLADKIYNFNLTIENAKFELERDKKELHEIAFCTILKNRIFHGGIIAKGSGMIKSGENGKGLSSRWYPKTLHHRIISIGEYKHKIKFISGDAFNVLEDNCNSEGFYFFIDPPYTIAGKRLYKYFNVDHERLFALVAQLKGKFMMTYDDTPEIRGLSEQYNLQYRTIPMKTTHHLQKNEIIISDNFSWWRENS